MRDNYVDFMYFTESDATFTNFQDPAHTSSYDTQSTKFMNKYIVCFFPLIFHSKFSVKILTIYYFVLVTGSVQPLQQVQLGQPLQQGQLGPLFLGPQPPMQQNMSFQEAILPSMYFLI